MIIRPAKQSDYETVMQLYNSFVGEDRYSKHDNDSFETVLTSADNFIYVAEIDNKIVGFATFSVRHVVRYRKPIAELDELFVHEDFRKHGLGRKLIQTIEEKAKELDCYRVYIESQYQHKTGHAFYESLGYENKGYHFLKNL